MRYVGFMPLRKQPYGTSANEGVVVLNEVVVLTEGVSNEGVVVLNE